MSLPQGPEGPKGEDGLSAYELWVKAIEDGTIEWEGNTEIVDFFYYLKGTDGEDGQSAYELWVEEAEAGNITDKNGDNWTDNYGTTIADFWYYLTGSDGINGQSAYELWVSEVEAGNIMDKNGDDWRDNHGTTVTDFWEYLRGADGVDGLSAYELWVKAINDGTITWTGGTDLADFYLYLKGQDGANGQSAYELWVSEVEAGNITDKNGNDWRDNNGTTVADFWVYLTGADGADGQSAFDLWVAEVLAGNIFDKEGNPWDTSRITVDDFWDYLRGADGKDGKVDGTTVVLGYYNVIARYYQSGTDYTEYVDATNGKVKYTVYDKTGATAPGATVDTITYIDESNNSQTITVNEVADTDGNIWLAADLLPTRVGSELTEDCQAIVTTTNGTPETAYANTIIPTKPQISVEFSNITLSSSTQYFYVRIQRSMDGGTTWENIPSYLATPSLAYVRYYIVDVNASPVDLSYTGTSAASKVASDMSNTVYAIISRPKVKTSYTTTGNYTGISDEKYYAAYLDSLYGQTAHSSEVALLTPINQVPRIENFSGKTESYDAGKGAYVLYGFSGDFKVSDIDQTLLSISVTKDTSYTPARWKYVPLTASELTAASMLQLYTSRSFTDGTVYEYSKTCNIYNVNTGDPLKTGFNDMTLYDGSTLYITGNSYVYNSYSYTVSRTSDATTATWTFTSSGLTDSYKTQTVQVAAFD